MEKFIELVKAGKIEGLRSEGHGYVAVLASLRNKYTSVCLRDLVDEDQNDIDHLCAHIRRWLSGKGWIWKLTPSHLALLPNFGPNVFTEGSELDWHIAAAVWVCEREG